MKTNTIKTINNTNNTNNMYGKQYTIEPAFVDYRHNDEWNVCNQPKHNTSITGITQIS